MARIAKGADRIAGRDALPERNIAEKLIKGEIPPPAFLPSTPPRKLHILTINNPGGCFICPGDCTIVSMVAWMASANNIQVGMLHADRAKGTEDTNPHLLTEIPVVRGSQKIEWEPIVSKRKDARIMLLKKLDVLEFTVTKPTAFAITVVFVEL